MSLRKPEWIRVKAPLSKKYQETHQLMLHLKLHTVCEEAACPNISECWSKKHATIMILGNVCTRACAFCNVKTGRPNPLDVYEPERIAEAIANLGLTHIVITSVDRDDLEDGGALQFAHVIQKIRTTSPKTTIEVLTPDFQRKERALETVIKAKPDVFNHNLETVPRIYPTVRPGGRYFHSLKVLSKVKELDSTLFTKSGLMVGLGEEKTEIYQVMDDLRSADVDFITLGQYLQPTHQHHPVFRYVTPDEFDAYAAMARGKGFLVVSASPLARSSYHADENFKRLQQARKISFHAYSC